MRDVYGKVKLGLKTRSTTVNRVNHDNLMWWGSCIKKQFDRDNLHLLAPTAMESNKKFTSSIVGCIRGLSSQLTTIVRQQDVLFQKVRELEMSVAEIHQLCLTSTSHPVNDRPPKRSSSEEVQTGDLSPGFGSPKKQSRLGLVYKSKSEREQSSDRKLSSFTSACSFFLDFKLRKIGLSSFHKQDRNRVKMVISFYNAFLTEEEVEMLGSDSTELSEKKSLVRKITKLIIYRFRETFKGCEKIPNTLSKEKRSSQFRPSSIQNLQSTLKRRNRSVVRPDPDLFHKFRNKKILEMREKKREKEKQTVPTEETPIHVIDDTKTDV